jgi:ubiquinol-cytochrome c reductase cytochrome b subunit
VHAIERIWGWLDRHLGLSANLGPILRHPVPPGSKWLYVFGSATLFVFILQVFTGTILASAYITSTGSAYDSLNFISDQAFLGRVVRGMHYFGASLMIVLIGVHAVRVFLTGSFKFPREMSWLTGSGLLLLTLLMGFTGQLLRWDQDGVWSSVIAAEQAGRTPFIGHLLAKFIFAGDTVGGATLSRFFAAHVFFIPGLIFLFIFVHLYLVLYNGISEPARAGRPVDPKTYRAWYKDMLHREGVPFWPDAGWRDAVFGAFVISLVFLLAVTFGPPHLGKPPDPTIIEASPRPDWYLLWYFALLALIPHQTERFVIILAPLTLVLVLVLLPFVANAGERSPARRPWALGIVLGVVVMIGTLWRQGAVSPWSPRFDARPLSVQVVGASTGPVAEGAALFHRKGCEYCHTIATQGGLRGPNLTYVADRLTRDQMTLRILNGATNMPAYGGNMSPTDLARILAFLDTRRHRQTPASQPVAR